MEIPLQRRVMRVALGHVLIVTLALLASADALGARRRPTS
jgi:hypothetical protein